MAFRDVVKYSPALVPDKASDIPVYLTRELGKLAGVLNQGNENQFPTSYAAPDKLVNGMVRLADGTLWNPTGFGYGFVYYSQSDNTWKPLGSPVQGSTIVPFTIGNQQYAPGSITGDKILDGAIGTLEIAAGSITSSLLADLAVISSKIANGAIGTIQLALEAVGTANIASAAITAAQLAASSVTAAALSAGCVNAAALANGAVTAAAIAAGALNFTAFASSIQPISIVSTLPSPTGYTGPKTVFNTTDLKLYRYDAVNSLWTVAVAGGDIVANSITAGQIAAGAIGATEIAAGAITTGAIAAGAVVTASIAANAIVAGLIAAGAITSVAIAAGAITADKIAAGAVVAGSIDVATLSAISSALGTVYSGLIEDATTLNVWQANYTPAVNYEIVDSNGNVQEATTVTGSTGATVPSPWATAIGSTTTDGGVTWTCKGFNTHFKIDLTNKLISIFDINNTLRFKAGLVATNDYDIQTYDPNGNLLFSADGITPNGSIIQLPGGLSTTAIISSTDNKTFFRAQKGSASAVTLNLGTYYGPTHGTGFYSGRFAYQKQDVFIDFHIDGDWGLVTTQVNVQYDGGAWENIYSFQTDCDYRGGLSGSLIYTTKSTAWNTLAIQCTTDGNTQAAAGRVIIANFVQSGNTADTVSGTTGNSTDPGYVRTTDNLTAGTNTNVVNQTNLTGGNVDLGKGGVAGKTLLNILDDPGSSRYAVLAIDPNRRPLIDLSQAHLHLTANYLTYLAGGTVDSLKPQEVGANVTETRTSALTKSLSTHVISDNKVQNGNFVNGLTDWTFPTGWFPGVSAGLPVGSTYAAIQNTSTVSTILGTVNIPIDFTKTYLMECWVYCTSAAATHFIGFAEYDSSGNSVQHVPAGADYGYALLAGTTLPAGTYKYLSEEVSGNGGTSPSATQFNASAASVVPFLQTNYNHTANVSEIVIVEFRISEVAAGARRAVTGLQSTGILQPNLHPVDNLKDQTYARMLQTEMTAGKHKLGISGSGAILGDGGNVPATTQAGQNYMLTGCGLSDSGTTSKTVSMAAGTVYYGTTGSLSLGASSVTGLAPSTKYYCYVDLPSWTGGTYQLVCTTDSTQISRSPMRVFIGWIMTQASGGGGGGVGPGCLHPSVWVLTRIGLMCADELSIGDELLLPDGRWRPILALTREPCAEWLDVETETGTARVTLTQPYRMADGGWTRAEQLHVGEALAHGLHVLSAAPVTEPSEKIILSIAKPHAFMLTERGPEIHNGTVKP